VPDSAFKRYLFEYRHDGAEWAMEISARDLDDAKARLKALPWAKYQGEVFATVHVPRTPLSRVLRRIRACLAMIAPS
jgi:hypothetical protein